MARAQLVLDRLGFLDLDRTDGPTGYADAGLDAALRAFQREHGLVADGWMRPDGPTIRAMARRLRQTVEPIPAEREH